jgi:hypothetical protein
MQIWRSRTYIWFARVIVSVDNGCCKYVRCVAVRNGVCASRRHVADHAARVHKSIYWESLRVLKAVPGYAFRGGTG